MRLRGLRHIRQRRGMSISQLAEVSDIRRASITRLEQGRDDAEPSLVRRLAIVLGVSQFELATGFLMPAPIVLQDQIPAI